MSVFYQGRRAFITHEVFETTSLTRHTYPIKDLADVRIVRTEPERSATDRVMGLSATGAALLVIPVVGPVSRILAGFAVLVLAVSAIASLGRRPVTRWDLVARHRGQATTLFSSADRTEFDQVCRGLRRSLERHWDVR